MPKVYAFDVDETLDISNGPIPVQALKDLRAQGHVVGLCGNGRVFCDKVPNWWEYLSFTLNLDFFKTLGGLLPKAHHLIAFSQMMYLHADEYILVGNIFGEKNSLGFVCGSHDSQAALESGWRFIKEDDFANGKR